MARAPSSSSSPDDNQLRKQLGLRVRDLRRRAGLTQTALAERVVYHQSVISRLEKGYKGSASVLEKVITALGVTPAEEAELRRLNAVNERGREERDRHLIESGAPWFRRILRCEPSATAILSWTGERLKGLLQAESYMIAQFSEHDVDDIANAVTERAGRTIRAFTENPGCRYAFLISESAVERLVQCETVNKYVAVDQLKHLLALSDRNPNIAVRVVPFAHRLHVNPDFTIMEFAAPEPPLGYSDLLRTLVTTDPGGLDIDHLYECWNRLSETALSIGETREVLEKALDRCQGSP